MLDTFEPKIGEKKSEEGKEQIEEHYKLLFDLSSAEIKILTQKVADHKGLIRIFVHPFYIRPVGSSNEEENSILRKLETATKKTINHLNSPATIILEEQGGASMLKKILGQIQNDVYIVPTFKSDSVPKFSDDKEYLHDTLDKKLRENWHKLIEQLETLNVKKIIIGGMLLGVRRRNKWERKRIKGDEDIKLEACVGHAFEKLSSNFDVELSSLTYNDNRLSLLKMKRQIEEQKSKETEQK